ncbi:MAG: universal stress protein [Bacteroidetes bacterium]|nr:universal stress protein [Bacteroidota bacterium]
MPEEYHKIAMNGLTRAKDKAKERFPDVNMVIHATMGSADLEIPAYANNIKADLIIMGTHGASGVSEFLIGSNAASVMENSLVPVLAIPEKAKIKELKKIAFAADYGNHNAGHLHFLIDLAKIFDSEIIMLHITSGNLEDNFEDLEIGRFKGIYIIKESGYKNISYRLIEDKDVFHGLNTYTEQFHRYACHECIRNQDFAQNL